MNPSIELGLDTFGDVTRGADGKPVPHAQVIRDVIDEAVLADEVGVDFIGVGEHHRDDFAISSPEVVLAAIAGRTRRIKLGSAVTVLSSDDPVRVFERFATLDAASNGRAEVILGRGSFTESFPLFGFPLSQYEALFEEKLDLFAAAACDYDRTGEPVTWEGTTRASLEKKRVFPTTEHGLKVWIGVGGSPESVVRAARYRLPLMLAIIGGDPRRFKPFVALYNQALTQMGVPPAGRRALARPHRGHRRASARRDLAGVQGDARSHRRRARLGADQRARSSTTKSSPDRSTSDRRRPSRRRSPTRRARSRSTVRHEVQRGHAGARQDDAQHRAVRRSVIPRVRELLR